MALDYLSVDPEIAKQLDCDPALKDYVEGMAVACHALFPKSTVNVYNLFDPDDVDSGEEKQLTTIDVSTNDESMSYSIKMKLWSQLSEYSQTLWYVIIRSNDGREKMPPFPTIVF